MEDGAVDRGAVVLAASVGCWSEVATCHGATAGCTPWQADRTGVMLTCCRCCGRRAYSCCSNFGLHWSTAACCSRQSEPQCACCWQWGSALMQHVPPPPLLLLLAYPAACRCALCRYLDGRCNGMPCVLAWAACMPIALPTSPPPARSYQPHGIKMLYDGVPVDLTPEQEEVATMFAVMKETGGCCACWVPVKRRCRCWG